ncbi:MAG: hypothetical protein VW548_04275 [Methylotenera sp.]
MKTCLNHLVLISILLGDIGIAQADAGLNRLFTTKAQRENLNKLRIHQASEIAPSPNIQGYVTRSDGLSTWWLDHNATPQALKQADKNAQKQ